MLPFETTSITKGWLAKDAGGWFLSIILAVYCSDYYQLKVKEEATWKVSQSSKQTMSAGWEGEKCFELYSIFPFLSYNFKIKSLLLFLLLPHRSQKRGSLCACISLKAQQFKFSANTSIELGWESFVGLGALFRCLISQQIEKFSRTNPCKVHRWRKFLLRISCCFLHYFTYLNSLKKKELSNPQQFFSFLSSTIFYFLIVFFYFHPWGENKMENKKQRRLGKMIVVRECESRGRWLLW